MPLYLIFCLPMKMYIQESTSIIYLLIYINNLNPGPDLGPQNVNITLPRWLDLDQDATNHRKKRGIIYWLVQLIPKLAGHYLGSSIFSCNSFPPLSLSPPAVAGGSVSSYGGRKVDHWGGVLIKDNHVLTTAHLSNMYAYVYLLRFCFTLFSLTLFSSGFSAFILLTFSFFFLSHPFHVYQSFHSLKWHHAEGSRRTGRPLSFLFALRTNQNGSHAARVLAAVVLWVCVEDLKRVAKYLHW